MDYTSCVDPILNELEEEWWKEDLPYYDPVLHGQVEIFKVQLQFLKTFLRYVVGWNDDVMEDWDDSDIDIHFGTLVLDIQAAVKQADVELSYADQIDYERRAASVDPIVSKLREKLDLFNPSIKEAYSYLSNYPFHSKDYSRNIQIWKEFPQFVQQNLLDLCTGKVDLPVAVIEQLKALIDNLNSLARFVNSLAEWPFLHQHPLSKDFLTHLGGLVVRAAGLSYVCCNDKLDEEAAEEMIVSLSNVQNMFKPNSIEVADTHLKILASSNSVPSSVIKGLMLDYVNFLVPEKDLFRTLRKGLVFLLEFFIRAPDLYGEVVTPILTDIVVVFRDVGLVNNSIHADDVTEEIASEIDIDFFLLLATVELLKAEVLLMELLNQRAGSAVLVKDQIDSFNEGLSFLGTLFQDPLREESESNKLMWMHIEAVARETCSLYNSFHAKEVTGDSVTDGLMELLEKIKLFKAEALARKLLSGYPYLILSVKDQVEQLWEGLIFLRTFLMSRLEEKGKLILRRVQAVAKEVGSFYHSFHASEITEEIVYEMHIMLPDMLEKIMHAKAEVREIYLQIRSSSRSNFPRTNGLGFVDFLLTNLRELLNYKADAISSVRHHVDVVHREIENFRSFLWDIDLKLDEHSEMQILGSRIIDVAYEAEFLIDSFVVKEGVLWYHVLWLSDLIEDIKVIKNQVLEVSEKKTYDISFHNVAQASRIPISPASIPRIDEVLVDLPDQVELIVDRLKRGSLHQDIVSIVGMPGLGKTTLAKKVYNAPSVVYHFHIRAWCHVSQVYRKRDLLLDVLSDIVEPTNNMREMIDEDLELELYQCLKRRRYLIVMDDLWSTEAWNDLERSLPNDENGSRILITSRLHDVALKAKPDSRPHALRLLSDDESWNLLQKKIFDTKDCPDELLEIGKQIAKNCKGLPLAVVAISGLLENTKRNLDWWRQVSERLNSYIVDDPQTRCRDILELSYKNLPDYLKPCFLYLGAFLQDKEIPVSKLIWLWVAEGFIQNTELERLEDVAEEYFMDLLGRSLVIVSKKRSKGGVKACRVHDMLRDLCLARCKEENFLQLIKGYDDEHFVSPSEDLDYGVDFNYSHALKSVRYEKHRLFICSKRKHFVMSRPSGPHVRSLLFFATSDMYPRCPYDVSFIFHNFKLLRVLDLESINMGNSFANGIYFLVHLRYLAVSGDIDSIPSSIANLWNLETFIVKGLKGIVTLPDSIWKMARLRHIHVNSHAVFSLQDDEFESSWQLHNLVSLSSPYLSCGRDTEKILVRFPNLRKLRCIFSQSWDDVRNNQSFPALNFLTKLESLKVFYSGRISGPHKFDFPLKLKKLTLSNFCLPWSYIAEIGKLPNLEVLKLLSRAFEGKIWDMREGEFLKLKFLKLDRLNIAQWNASSDHLPKLERLVLQSCKHLEEVPSDFGEITALQMIEMQLCSHSAEESVRRIKEEQLEMGNEDLKVIINLSDWNFRSSS